MTDIFGGIVLGLGVAMSPVNIAMVFVGCLLGTLIGVLPGIGPMATIAMLMPATYHLPPEASLIMLAGVYYGAQYGGSTTSILLRLPGESSSVVTCLDGNAMARNGRAGSALAIAAIGSFVAGTFATLYIAVAAPLISSLVLQFGPAEYFMVMVVGLLTSVTLAQGSFLRALAMILVGLLLGAIGGDPTTGMMRFTFDIPSLYDGVALIPLAMGLFGIADILVSLEQEIKESFSIAPVGRLWPSRQEFRDAWGAIARGTVVGSLLGVLPGSGGVLGSFVAYTVEKRVSKHPERFGSGMIEGVAGPESGNNAAAQTSFIPLLTLGLPSNGIMALIAGAMMIQGIVPGPNIMEKQPTLFWGVIASMWVGNLMLVVINLPLIGIWVRLLRVPYRLLYPAILLFCAIGVYSINNDIYDIYFAALFGFVGYLFIKWRCEPAPLVLAFILGRLMEENLRRALLLSRGSFWVLFESPINQVLVFIAVALFVAMALPKMQKWRARAFVEPTN